MAGKENKDDKYDEATEDRGQAGSASDKPRGDWRATLSAMARRVLDEDELARLREHADDVGAVGDMVVAAHLEDLLFLERARFHRARRDVGLAMATGSKGEVTVAQDRLRAVAADLGILRLQRDLATGEVQLDVGGGSVKGERSAAD